MLLPYATDAPLYHGPWATLGVIAANVVVFAASVSGGWSNPEDYILWYGQGLHPLQWLTSNFLHAGVFHLLGNMLFLWVFGLVVEGKTGWWGFLLIYLGIGVTQAALQQVCMLGATPFDEFDEFAAPHGSLGASAAIYGLMAIALVWAPQNEFSCYYWFAYRMGLIDLPIMWFAGIDLTFQVLFAALWGFNISTEMLHLGGAVLGFATGSVLVLGKVIDCEGWDLFATMAGRAGVARTVSEALHRDVGPIAPRPKKQRLKEIEDDDTPDEKAPTKHHKQAARIRTLAQQHKPDAALREHQRLKQAAPEFLLPEQDLMALVDAVYRAELWNDAVPLMEECIARFPERCQKLRVILAEIVVTHQRRPQHALRILEPVVDAKLPPRLQQQRAEIASRCRQLIDDGLLELEGRPWQT
jgi:membrane associated rhomboid family serine protease